jgi:hypothetical protein
VSARLASHIEVSGLIRRAEAAGGNAMVLRRGDSDAGAILLLIAERGIVAGVLERSVTLDDRYAWHFRNAEEIERKQDINHYVDGRAAIDPDIWVLELDIPQAQRFAAELASAG